MALVRRTLRRRLRRRWQRCVRRYCSRQLGWGCAGKHAHTHTSPAAHTVDWANAACQGERRTAMFDQATVSSPDGERKSGETSHSALARGTEVAHNTHRKARLPQQQIDQGKKTSKHALGWNQKKRVPRQTEAHTAHPRTEAGRGARHARGGGRERGWDFGRRHRRHHRRRCRRKETPYNEGQAEPPS